MSHYNEQREADEIWKNAPGKASCYGGGHYWMYCFDYKQWLFWNGVSWETNWVGALPMDCADYSVRPQANTKPHQSAQDELKHPTTSNEYLAACAQVQSERAKQYDTSGTGERSFEAAAEAFNCVTGKNIRGSDVCLILEMVKLVRQYSDPTRLHEDSVLDAVSYASLWAEELTKELRHV